MATAHSDYSWVTEFHNGLLSISGYCLTLVSGTTVADAIARLGGEDTGEIQDLEGLVDNAFETQSSSGFRSTSAGLCRVSGWTLVFEPNGFLGVTPTVAERLASDGVLVSHFRNVNAHGQFAWWERGEPQLKFDPLLPSQRHGPQAQEMVATLRAAGSRWKTRQDGRSMAPSPPPSPWPNVSQALR